MKLVRASCDCGFITRKARSGYHHDQWWFPLFCPRTGELTDILRVLPREDQKRIDQITIDVLMSIPHTDKAARRIASAKVRRLSLDIQERYITRETERLRDEYATEDARFLFNPAIETGLGCPRCGNDTLILDQVFVLAHCKHDCGHEYQWPDSEESGCPKCGHRPHCFTTESEDSFASEARTFCSCQCSSSTNCTTHIDGYCPKCGSVPESYFFDDAHYCGVHHERMISYRLPENFIFMETASCGGRISDPFPNAKQWGDAPDGTDGHPSFYCVTCESTHQRYLG